MVRVSVCLYCIPIVSMRTSLSAFTPRRSIRIQAGTLLSTVPSAYWSNTCSNQLRFGDLPFFVNKHTNICHDFLCFSHQSKSDVKIFTFPIKATSYAGSIKPIAFSMSKQHEFYWHAPKLPTQSIHDQLFTLPSRIRRLQPCA